LLSSKSYGSNAREEAKKSSPWIGYASTAYQLAIVVLSASILAVSVGMFWGSFASSWRWNTTKPKRLIPLVLK
jgi:hypothetical protein